MKGCGKIKKGWWPVVLLSVIPPVGDFRILDLKLDNVQRPQIKMRRGLETSKSEIT